MRLFDTGDGDITFMLWGVERSTARLQAAMSRSSKYTDKTTMPQEESEEEEEEEAGKKRTDVPEIQRPVSYPQELVDRMMHWGDDGSGFHDIQLNVPITDRLIAEVRERKLKD